MYRIRKLSEEEFIAEFSGEENLKKLHAIFKRAMDLNVQRSAQIKIFDEVLLRLIKSVVAGEDVDAIAVQDQHKTY